MGKAAKHFAYICLKTIGFLVLFAFMMLTFLGLVTLLFLGNNISMRIFLGLLFTSLAVCISTNCWGCYRHLTDETNYDDVPVHLIMFAFLGFGEVVLIWSLAGLCLAYSF